MQIQVLECGKGQFLPTSNSALAPIQACPERHICVLRKYSLGAAGDTLIHGKSKRRRESKAGQTLRSAIECEALSDPREPVELQRSTGLRTRKEPTEVDQSRRQFTHAVNDYQALKLATIGRKHPIPQRALLLYRSQTQGILAKPIGHSCADGRLLPWEPKVRIGKEFAPQRLTDQSPRLEHSRPFENASECVEGIVGGGKLADLRSLRMQSHIYIQEKRIM